MTQILKKGMKVVDLCDGCIHILVKLADGTKKEVYRSEICKIA